MIPARRDGATGSAVDAAERKMRDAGISDAGIAAFERLRGLLRAGDRGVLPTAELEPVDGVPALADLPAPGPAERREALDPPSSSASTAAWGRRWG